MLTESVEIGIPRGSGANVVATFARLFENFIARVLDSDRRFFALGRGHGKNRVKRTVFFPAFLDELQALSLVIEYSRDAQIREQSKLHDPLAGHKRLEADGGAAEQVAVLGDDG